MNSKLPLIIYDSECPLCVRFKQGLEILDFDKRINFVPLSEAQIFAEFPELKAQECAKVVHLITEERSVLKGSEVITYLLKYYPGVSKLAWLLETDQGKKVVDFFYNKVEEIRHKFKTEECDRCPHSSE